MVLEAATQRSSSFVDNKLSFFRNEIGYHKDFYPFVFNQVFIVNHNIMENMSHTVNLPIQELLAMRY